MIETRSQRTSTTIAGALFGNYRIVEPLKRGGMGSVYLARHAVLGRPAAVKILRPELTTNGELVQRFLNEAKAATAIRHPGIVEVYDYGTNEQGIAYLVMELLEGTSLAARLADRGRMAEAEAVLVTRGIASALKAAHAIGIVHRDLKPENVFLVPDPDGPTGERIKVLDFGIAKLLDPSRAHHTQTGALIGTPIYMAPEQARAASAIDHRADLYSLGCLLYEVLAGRPPFLAMGAGEIIALHLFTPPEPPSRYAPMSQELERIVLRLLEKEPHDRFQSAGELIDALDGLHAAARRAEESRPHAVPAMAGLRLALADEQPMQGPEKRSAMGLVAGLITAAIAAAVALFIVTRGSGDDETKPVKEPEAGSAATTTPPPPPTTTTTPTTPPPTTAAQPQPTPPPPPPPPPQAEPASKPQGAPVTHGHNKPKPRPAAHPPKATGAKGDATSGPVTHPDGPITRPDPGGPSTDQGSPINENLEPDKKP